MSNPADRPGSAASANRAATLRIKRGEKTLSEVPLGRARLIIGGGQTAQLRLKNAGLADECVVLDLREEPFHVESLLEPTQVLVNDLMVVGKTSIGPGDKIVLFGITLELLDANGRSVPKQELLFRKTERDPDDPYMGKRTAARVTMEEIEKASLNPPGSKSPFDREKMLNAPTENDIAAARKKAPDTLKESDGVRAAEVKARSAPPPPKTNAGIHAPTQREMPAAAPTRSKRGPPVGAVDLPEPTRSQDLPAAKPKRPVDTPWIELIADDGSAESKLYIEESGYTAGRQGDIKIQHASVSKKHAAFHIQDGGLVVEDLGSTNGTWINRERITGTRKLQNDDTLHLGAVEFRVRVPGAAATNEIFKTRVSAREPDPDTAPRSQPPMVRNGGNGGGGIHRPTEREIGLRPPPPAPAAVRALEIDRAVEPSDPPLMRGTTDEPAPRASRSSSSSSGMDLEAALEEEPLEVATPAPRRQPSPFQDSPTMDRAPRREKSDQFRPAPTGQFKVAVRAPEPILPPPQSRGGAMFAIGSLMLLVGATAAGGWMAWPRVQMMLKAEPTPIAFGTPVPQQTVKGSRATPVPTADGRLAMNDKRNQGRDRLKGGATPIPEHDVVMDLMATPTATPESRPGRDLFNGLDVAGDKRVDLARKELEQGSPNSRLRQERTIGDAELKSIFLDQGTAVVRKFDPAVGFDMAPSSYDDQDESDRAVGAKQLDPNKVNALIRGRFGDVKKCLVGTGGWKGGKARVVVQFTINPDGKISSLSVPQSDIKGAKFEGCVTSVIRQIKFPKPKEQSVVVQFPFVFFYN